MPQHLRTRWWSAAIAESTFMTSEIIPMPDRWRQPIGLPGNPAQSLSIGRCYFPATAQRESGLDLDSAAVDRVRLERPLPQRLLYAFALRIRRADHVHVLHGPVAADDDACWDRHRRWGDIRGRDLADDLVACRVIANADRNGAFRRESETIEALHNALPLVWALRRHCDAHEMAADLCADVGAVETDAAEIDTPCRAIAHHHL